MNLAILKPDHLGDLVLASPAIRAMCAANPDSTLFVASRNIPLATFLFPGVEVRPADLPHLIKTGQASIVPDLSAFDAVAVLRADQVLNGDWAALRTRRCALPVESQDDHQTLIDYSVAYGFTDEYDIDAMFYGANLEAVADKATRPPRRLGLSLGSGFHANSWAAVSWIALIREVIESVDEVVLLGGPAESAKAAFIAERLGHPARLRSVVGLLDPVAFVRACADFDLVVASDGGTGHLCSLSCPVLSIFGPSPFRRYAPFGRLNRVLTRDLACSPCCQYTMHLVNGCFTNECMGRITARHVRRALALPPARTSRARAVPLDGDVKLYYGTSHLDRAAKLQGFHAAMQDAFPLPA